PIARRVEAYAEFRSPVFFPSQVCLRAEEAQPSIERTRHWAVQSNDGSQLHAAGMLRELGEV
ncbi:MAG: hypothetical protein NZ533_11565, partial [Casimicrobiaceae bacterium]|nr:hypothetical protein [Casimicrobiaceae bacterium]